MITRAIEKSFKRAKQKGWNKTFWAFDIHETIILPNWKYGTIPTEFYPLAKETLQLISSRDDIVMLLFTCSHPHEIPQYVELFKKEGIHFAYVNENPEVLNEKYGYYDSKPYFNVLFEDKAGFDPYEDWGKVKELLEAY